jgi:hypothetical protein
LKAAEDCCKGHCQHPMVGEMAVSCCQSHQARASHAPLVVSPTKALVLTVTIVLVSVFSSGVFLGAERFLSRLRWEWPPSSSRLYAFHCALLI